MLLCCQAKWPAFRRPVFYTRQEFAQKLIFVYSFRSKCLNTLDVMRCMFCSELLAGLVLIYFVSDHQ